MKRSRQSKPFKRILAGVASLALTCFAASGFADTIEGIEGEIVITPLVHSSVQLEYQEMVVQVDPWGIVGLNKAKQADLILVTDSPGHHLDTQAITQLSKPGSSVVIAANGRDALPGGIVVANGDKIKVSGVTIEAVAAYDIIPGAPEHPKGDANGYVLDLGGKRFFFAGVTECVDEVLALRNIDVAFMPMNIPVGRMTPAAAAECTVALKPDVVYTYHFDQDWARRQANPDYAGSTLPGGITVNESLDLFEASLSGSGIEFRRGDWYP